MTYKALQERNDQLRNRIAAEQPSLQLVQQLLLLKAEIVRHYAKHYGWDDFPKVLSDTQILMTELLNAYLLIITTKLADGQNPQMELTMVDVLGKSIDNAAQLIVKAIDRV